MNIISIDYVVIYRLKYYKDVQFTEDLKRVFSYKKSKERKYSVNGSKGLKVNSKVFIKFTDLHNHIELIPKHEYIKDDFLTNL